MTQREDWIEWKWTPEKPYPGEKDTKVFLRWSDGNNDDHGWKVEEWIWAFNTPGCGEVHITHYRIASEGKE